MRIYAEASVPSDLIEAARIDGAGEFRIFRQIAFRLLAPGFVTVLLFTFVATWNNYFLPLVMLSEPKWYPLTVGLAQWNAQATAGGGATASFNTVITGVADLDHPADPRVHLPAALLAERARLRRSEGLRRAPRLPEIGRPVAVARRRLGVPSLPPRRRAARLRRRGVRRRGLGPAARAVALAAARLRRARPTRTSSTRSRSSRRTSRTRTRPATTGAASSVPAEWAGTDAVLRFEGVDSCLRAWLNGVELGVVDGQPAADRVRRRRRCCARARRTSSRCACTSGRRAPTSRTRTCGGCRGSSAASRCSRGPRGRSTTSSCTRTTTTPPARGRCASTPTRPRA